MTMRFQYVRTLRRTPSVPFGGALLQPRPLIPVTLIGPSDTRVEMALVDTGADETIFPETTAQLIGLDLTQAPTSTGSGVGTRSSLAIRFAKVTLRLADLYEHREWVGWVGFTAAPLRNPLLGFAGCLQYFTATFHGDREIVELTVNTLYPGI